MRPQPPRIPEENSDYSDGVYFSPFLFYYIKVRNITILWSGESLESVDYALVGLVIVIPKDKEDGDGF